MDDETLCNSAQGFRAPFHRSCAISCRCAQLNSDLARTWA
jgi:hypothetical protein